MERIHRRPPGFDRREVCLMRDALSRRLGPPWMPGRYAFVMQDDGAPGDWRGLEWLDDAPVLLYTRRPGLGSGEWHDIRMLALTWHRGRYYVVIECDGSTGMSLAVDGPFSHLRDAWDRLSEGEREAWLEAGGVAWRF